MVFDTNLAKIKWIAIAWTDYDGEKFKKIDGLKSIVFFVYSRFWISFIIYDATRFFYTFCMI